ncbi:MAG: hypothetical protein WAK17_06850 [Candidatus Nitrosopolaris sp.]
MSIKRNKKCNGFIDGQQAVAEHRGVKSHINGSIVLPHNAIGFSKIGRPI